MIRIATTEQARKIDVESQERYSLQARDLMNTAGRKAAQIFQKIYPDKNAKIVILCGPGNNGGDGVVVYRELMAAKYLQLSCFFTIPPKSPVVLQQVRMLSKNIPVMDEKTPWPSATVYVDALFGIGLNQDIQSQTKSYIEKINLSRAQNKSQTFSLDLPSGVCSNTGNARGTVIEADHTVTFGVYKLGQWIQDGPKLCGKLHRVDIGFPKELVKEIACTHFVFTHKDFLKALPQRIETSNKSNHGHVKIWAGSKGMWGAAVLSATAAYRAGAGYVSIESTEPYFADLPEVLVETESPIDNKFTYAVGPGWGSTPAKEKKIKTLLENNIEKVVLDADALNILSNLKTPIKLKKNWILTPHTKELSRMLKIDDTNVIETNRSKAIIQAEAQFKSVILLKGYRTLIARGKKVIIIPTGNSALAKAGSGDVLTGIIAGLRAQNMSALKAAACGAYLHGLMSNIWVKKNHPNTLTPSDLLKGLPKILKLLTAKPKS